MSKYVPGIKLADIERVAILEALEYHQGNRKLTAADLGISRGTLTTRIAAYRLQGYAVTDPPRVGDKLWRPGKDATCPDPI